MSSGNEPEVGGSLHLPLIKKHHENTTQHMTTTLQVMNHDDTLKRLKMRVHFTPWLPTLEQSAYGPDIDIRIPPVVYTEKKNSLSFKNLGR